MLPYHLCEPSFVGTYALLTPSERAHIKRLVTEVRTDPDPDDIRKIRIPYLGSLYVQAIDDEGYWLLYFVQNQVVYCVSCGHGSPHTDPLVDLT